MSSRCLFLVLIALAGVSPAGEPPAGNFAAQKVRVDGVERVYRLIVPQTVDLRKPAPLVVAFHGMLIDSKDLMPLYTKLGDLAAKQKFLVAFPNALDRSFGLKPEKIQADLAFFDSLVKQVSANYQVDSRRIYVCGMSNGGYFAHLVGKERSTTVAAVASHSGPLGLQTLLGVRAERKFPVLILHGDKDPLFPIAFARENRDKYQREGHKVQFVELAGQGHMWAPDASETIWNFFRQQSLK